MYEYFCKGDTPESDLACERRKADLSSDGVEYSKHFSGPGVWERIKITNENGTKSIGRPIGNYDTLSFERMDLFDSDAMADAANEVSKELCLLFGELGVAPERLLVVGLGNSELTPDAIGPRCAELVCATMHIKEHDEAIFNSLECAEIAVIKPGVTSESGLDAASTVRSTCQLIKPNALLAIDALASSSAQRLGRTIQFSNTGIFPGSGIGNPRGAITKETVGAPVIAIGVPTVIDARILAGKEDLLGGETMFVSPKEINGIVKAAAKIIADGINQAFGISL